MSLQSGQRSRNSFGACKTCRHVQISILTLNFNTSFVGNLTNVATLEYFTLTVFFFVFVERCIECYTWVAVFDENTRFSGHGMLFSWIPRRLSCPWYCCCLVDSAGHLLNTWLGASLYFCCLLFTLPCLSQCFWNDTEKMSMSLRKCWHPSIEKCSQVSCCTVSAM